MPKISREAEESKKRIIIDNAYDLFAEKGYSQTTMDDIVKASGISKGGIYNYFKSKEEIFLEIANDRFKLRSNFIRNFPKEMTNKDKITSYIQLILTGLLEEKVQKMARFTFEFWAVLSRNPDMSKRAKNRYHMFYNDLADVLQQGVEHGEFNENIDISSMAYIILATMDGIGFVNSVMGIAITSKVIDNYTDIILSKILK